MEYRIESVTGKEYDLGMPDRGLVENLTLDQIFSLAKHDPYNWGVILSFKSYGSEPEDQYLEITIYDGYQE